MKHLGFFPKRLAIATLAISLVAVAALKMRGDPINFSVFAFQTQKGIQLTTSENYLKGSYTHQGKEFTFEVSRPAAEMSTTVIKRADSSIVAECTRRGKAIVVRVFDLTVIADSTKTDAPVFTEPDKLKFEEALKSQEAAVLRRIIVELNAPAQTIDRKLLTGFLALAMVLGDGEIAPAEAEKISFSDKTKSSPNMRSLVRSFVESAAKSKTPSSSLSTRAPKTADECMGCCGPGCWGCTGCYTTACSVHDQCVAALGHIACLGFLADAVASILECPAA